MVRLVRTEPITNRKLSVIIRFFNLVPKISDNRMVMTETELKCVRLPYG
ncbi:unnamed protein product [Arabidopsis halleri]